MAPNTPARQDRTEVAIVNAETLERLDKADSELQIAMQGAGALTEAEPWKRAFLVTTAMQEMREALMQPGVMDKIMKLQGSSLGFKTDLDKEGGYPVPVVVDATIEARMHGAFMMGNESNIIKSRFMAVQAYYTRRLNEMREDDTLEYAEFEYGVPQVDRDSPPAAKGYNTKTEVVITWKRPSETTEQAKTKTFPVRMNAGTGVDAVLGKVKRRAEQWLVECITGRKVPTVEQGGPVIDTEVVHPRPDRTQAAPPAEPAAPPPDAVLPLAIVEALDTEAHIALAFFQSFDSKSPFHVTNQLREMAAGVREGIIENAELWRKRLAVWQEGQTDAVDA